MKVSIVKQNALGETLQIESTVKGPEEWESKIRPIFQALDHRMFELNLRVLTVNKEVNKLNPTEFAHLRDILAAFNNVVVEPPKVEVQPEAQLTLPEPDPEPDGDRE